MTNITRRLPVPLPAHVLRALFIGLLVTLVACTPGGPSDDGADASPASTAESTTAPTAAPPEPGATDDYDY